MYERPVIYTSQQSVTGEQLEKAEFPKEMLAGLQSSALHTVIAEANARGDYLDPNSVLVTVRVEARAL